MKPRRRNYCINPSYQAKFSAKFAALIILEAAVVGILFQFLSRGTITAGYYGQEMKIQKTSEFFFTHTLIVFTLVGLAVALFGMLIFIVHSHRIAGPLYRFEKDLKEIGSGNFAMRLNLRKKDEFHAVAESLNALTVLVDSKVGQIKKEVSALSQAAKAGNNSDFKESLERIQKITDDFKTTP